LKIHKPNAHKKSGEQNSEIKQMEILSAGAFINLENQEKIEQLKFTAAELANAALATEGFAGDEESGRRLALEFWQGLEYMCRETEELAIKNIFTNHFLDRLRELRPIHPTAAIELPPDSEQIVTQPIVDDIKPADEFLGVVETTDNEMIQTEDDETSMNTKDFSILENDSSQEREVRTTENNSIESVESQSSPAEDKPEKVAPTQEKSVEAKTTVSNLALPEKEPYQWGKCTVTATIQLLPAGDDDTTSRKAVLSVRTHDFAPQISLVELAGNNLIAELAPKFEKVLAKYQSDLPAKVMDKLKKEKTAAKRSAPKTTSEVKTVSHETAKPKESVNTQTAPPAANQTDTPSIPPAAQTGQQGSLFGF
jgi:hypothetical protein